MFDLRRSAFIRAGRGQADVAPRFEQGPSRKRICYFGQGQRILVCVGGKVSCCRVLTVPDIYINRSSNIDQQQPEEWVSTPSRLEGYRVGQKAVSTLWQPRELAFCLSLPRRIKWKDRGQVLANVALLSCSHVAHNHKPSKKSLFNVKKET